MVNICSLQETEHDGFDSFVLANGHIQVCVVPELGGKITSIYHLSTPREWLWSNPYLPTQAVAYGASFDMPFIWSIHPILKIEEGMQLLLPAGVETVRVDAITNSFLGESGSLLQ